MSRSRTYRNELSKVPPTDASEVLDVVRDGGLGGPSRIRVEHEEYSLKAFIVNDGVGA